MSVTLVDHSWPHEVKASWGGHGHKHTAVPAFTADLTRDTVTVQIEGFIRQVPTGFCRLSPFVDLASVALATACGE